ncbi:MAG: hypothetical protein COA92_05450 [Sulfurovum sp.]|nr:MAG: hypothetical protein COA92_05450 [Sulfurovum sp.]
MYDIKPLEEKWNRYHGKKRRPISVFLSLLVFVGIFIFLNDDNILQIEKNNTSTIAKSSDRLDNISPQKNVSIPSKIVNNDEQSPIITIVENIPILEEEIEQKYSKNEHKKPYKKLQLNIVESSSLDAYKDVEKRFYKTRDIDDSLFLAKSYYRKGIYKKSEYWALQTNKINSNIDESWIIFAQSKMKQGQKNEAVRILSNYVKRSGSEKAKNILNKFKNN